MDEASILRSSQLPSSAIWLDSLDLSKGYQAWDSPASKSPDGRPITFGGVVYEHGVATYSRSELTIDLKGSAERFEALVGVGDDRPVIASVSFEVWVDGERVTKTRGLRTSDEPELVKVSLNGASRMRLVATDAGDGIVHGFANWANAILHLKPGATDLPEAVGFVDEPAPPIAHTDFAKLGIHGPRIVGTTPGRDFVFSIPATGSGRLRFSASNLPNGLSLDPETGIISGRVENPGETIVHLNVEDADGSVSRKLKIVAGENKLALTPPMGWNSWNVWAAAVDDGKVRAAADSMIEAGLAAFGYNYVNIDDCWEAGRDENSRILSNEKFPDMKALADYVHSKGLRIGIYSSPGPRTCGGYEGSYRHEESDAKSYAEWEMDYLKYDWCSYTEIAKDYSREELEKPFRVMREALDKCGRDIVYSFSNGGEGRIWEWGEKVGGNCWRTTIDVHDDWGSIQAIAFTQDGRDVYAGPGRWNDVDMLVVGNVGWGPNLHPTKLTRNEQITHITAWSLLASPLLIGCNMSELDGFTLDLLTNEEVLDVNQDPLGRQSKAVAVGELTEVWSRPLWDGTMAVGLFNRGPDRMEVTAAWSDLGIEGPQPVRDLWQKKDLGEHEDSFSANVPAHGAMLLKIGEMHENDW